MGFAMTVARDRDPLGGSHRGQKQNDSKKSSSGAKDSYSPGGGDNPDKNKSEEYAHGENKDGWHADHPGQTPGDGASSDERSEPDKYKGFRERFHKEIQKKPKSSNKAF